MAESSEAITGKFDFYDVLGYLVPGLVLLGLVSLPFGLIKGYWPSTSFTSAVLYLVGAHILGHILQGLLRAWESVPRIRDKKGKMRNPSSVLLDANESLTPFLPKIQVLTNKLWGIPKNTESWANVDDLDRDATFLQARNLLLQSKKQSYIEQFQGKYALMGGMALSLLVAAVYYAGWAVGLAPCSGRNWINGLGQALLPYLVVLVVYLVVVQLLSGWVSKGPQRVLNMILLIALGLAAFLGGLVVASIPQQPSGTQKALQTEKAAEEPRGACATCAICCVGKSDSNDGIKASSGLQIEHKARFMLILALAAFGAAVRCYGAYKAFAREFAMGVWRDFANFDLLAEPASK